jgi:hypothetical protein
MLTSTDYDLDDLDNLDDGAAELDAPAPVPGGSMRPWRRRGDPRLCDYCGRDYPARRSDSRTCSPACRQRAHRAAAGVATRAIATTYTDASGAKVTLSAAERAAGVARLAAVELARVVAERDRYRASADAARSMAAHYRRMADNADRDAERAAANADRIDAETGGGQQTLVTRGANWRAAR